MNDFAHLAEAHHTAKNTTGLPKLSIRLAQTPCGPLHRSHGSPDREITAYVTKHTHRRAPAEHAHTTASPDRNVLARHRARQHDCGG
jgi:hypothetical protein